MVRYDHLCSPTFISVSFTPCQYYVTTAQYLDSQGVNGSSSTTSVKHIETAHDHHLWYSSNHHQLLSTLL